MESRSITITELTSRDVMFACLINSDSAQSKRKLNHIFTGTNVTYEIEVGENNTALNVTHEEEGIISTVGTLSVVNQGKLIR